MSFPRAESDESRPEISSSFSEDGPAPGTVGSQEDLSRSSSGVRFPPADDNSHCLLSYRGRMMASFEVKGRRLICLPQALDLFLRDLVGGLHTVYTKLRRLGVKPVVCSVEQVRILRRLGAIQPGVNRCKMISPTEFDLLYDDCTNSRIRPGRPLKRSVQSSKAYVHSSVHITENMMKTDSKPAVTSFPVGFLDWRDIWRRSPAMMLPVTSVLDSRHALGCDPLCWRAHRGIPGSSCLGMKLDSHVTWHPAEQSSGCLSAGPFHLRRNMSLDRRGENPCVPRPVFDDEENEPLNLEVRGKGRSPGFASVKSSEDKSRENCNDCFREKSETAEEVCTSRGSNDTGERTSSTDRCMAPPDGCYGNYGNMTSPPLDCNNSFSAYDTPSFDCVENFRSIEKLLKDAHELVMMAAKNSHQREIKISCEKEHLEMQATKELELRQQVQRHLATEMKNRLALQRKLRKDRRLIRRLQSQLSARNPDGRQQNHKIDDSESGSIIVPEGTKCIADT